MCALFALALTLALGTLAAPASALPGDPGLEPLQPADGAELATDPDGIAVSFSCPQYRQTDFGGAPFDVYGFSDDYQAYMATSPDTGADGRLRQENVVASTTGPQFEEQTCDVRLGTGPGSARPRPQETPGTYYWQAARPCSCDGGWEAGPVRRFVLRGAVKLSLKPQPRAYVGYPFFVPIAVDGAPDGTSLLLQRRRGSRWRTVARTSSVLGAARPLVRLVRGRQRLRVRASLGSDTFTSRVRRVTVRRAARWSTSRRDDGAYRDRVRPSLRLRVERGGRRVRGFAVDVPTTCGTSASPNVATVTVGPMRIAPDGRFVTRRRTRSTAVEVAGRVGSRRISGGEARIVAGGCAGSVRFSARRSGA